MAKKGERSKRDKSGWLLSPYSSDFNSVSSQTKPLRPVWLCPEEYGEGGHEPLRSPLLKHHAWFVASTSPFNKDFVRRPLHRQHDHFIWAALIWILQMVTQFSPWNISPIFYNNIFALSINSHTHLYSLHVMYSFSLRHLEVRQNNLIFNSKLSM